MPKWRPELEREAVKRLFNQLQLAIKLLEAAQSDGDLAWRAGLIGIARDAYRHTIEALGRIPPLQPADRNLVYDRMAEVRSVLALLEIRIREQLIS